MQRYEKIIMTLKSENARLKNELKNAVLGLQREKKDAGKAKKEAEIAAQQAEAAKLKAALHEAAVNARAGAISGVCHVVKYSFSLRLGGVHLISS